MRKMSGIYVNDGRGVLQKLKKGMIFCQEKKRIIDDEDWEKEDDDIDLEDLNEREYIKGDDFDQSRFVIYNSQ